MEAIAGRISRRRQQPQQPQPHRHQRDAIAMDRAGATPTAVMVTRVPGMALSAEALLIARPLLRTQRQEAVTPINLSVTSVRETADVRQEKLPQILLGSWVP